MFGPGWPLLSLLSLWVALGGIISGSAFGQVSFRGCYDPAMVMDLCLIVTSTLGSFVARKFLPVEEFPVTGQVQPFIQHHKLSFHL